MSPGPGDYNLHSFTDRLKPSLFKQTLRKHQRKSQTRIQPSPRECSLAKPLSGGVFGPMGAITKEKTVGFNYPPMRVTKFSQAGNTLFYKTDGFGQQSFHQKNYSTHNARNTAGAATKQNPNMPEMGTNSDASSISR